MMHQAYPGQLWWRIRVLETGYSAWITPVAEGFRFPEEISILLSNMGVIIDSNNGVLVFNSEEDVTLFRLKTGL